MPRRPIQMTAAAGRLHAGHAAIAAAGAALGLVGCRPSTVPGSASPTLDAVVSWDTTGSPSDAETRVQGTAIWQADSGFVINADGTGASTRRSFQFVRIGGGRPAPGRYALGPLTPSRPPGAMYATYLDRATDRTDTTRAFVSLSGELTITQSDGGVVAGNFAFIAAEYSALWISQGRGASRGAGTPTDVTDDAPRVRVSGLVSAVPAGAAYASPAARQP